MSERTWSQEQNAIFDWFARPNGTNLIVEAYAGTGKSTTITEGVNRAPETSIIVAAFNTSAAADLKTKITNPNAEVMTLHSVGFRAVKRYWERIGVDNTGKRAAALAEAVCGAQAPDAIKRLVAKLCTKGREMAPLAVTADELTDIALQFECNPDEQWKDDGYDLVKVCRLAVQAMDIAAKVKPVATGIDFADMLYLPIRNRWLRAQYQLGVVDETQDMTLVQLALFQGVCAGRKAIVGDRRQAIYAFRGADSGSMDRLQAELQASTLKLSTTYRCGKAIVAAAQKFVPDFKAAPTNGNGLVSTCTLPQLEAQVGPGDFVLSRVNAPLVSIALGLIRRGRKARIQGRDIGAGLRAIVNKCATGPAKTSIPKWLERLTAWKEREVVRAVAQKKDSLVDKVIDQYETLLALVDGCAGIPELRTRLENLFADNGTADAVVCSSVHKAKGLEAHRVFVLEYTLNPPVSCEGCHKRPKGCVCANGYVPDPMAQREEQNIEYVAITRAKHELTWVTK